MVSSSGQHNLSSVCEQFTVRFQQHFISSTCTENFFWFHYGTHSAPTTQSLPSQLPSAMHNFGWQQQYPWSASSFLSLKVACSWPGRDDSEWSVDSVITVDHQACHRQTAQREGSGTHWVAAWVWSTSSCFALERLVPQDYSLWGAMEKGAWREVYASDQPFLCNTYWYKL